VQPRYTYIGAGSRGGGVRGRLAESERGGGGLTEMIREEAVLRNRNRRNRNFLP
jgi:hypothetical protein